MGKAFFDIFNQPKVTYISATIAKKNSAKGKPPKKLYLLGQSLQL